MTAVNKIDSNFTGLRFAVEASAGVLPANPVWLVAEPNSYDKFGGSVKTVARNPINEGRQRKKGVVVDVEAEAGYEMDLTSDNSPVLMESFMFAQARRNAELAAPTVTAAGSIYAPASGGAAYYAGNLMFAKAFTKDANNGLRVVTGTPTGTSVAATGSVLENEGGSAGIISRVGHEFGSGVATIDVSGTLPKLMVSGIVAASSVYTTVDNFTNGETVTIDANVYTFQTVLTNVAGNVKIGATQAASLVNLQNAINRDGTGAAGTDFAALCVAHPTVTAVAAATTLTVTAIVAGTPGNAIVTSDTSGDASWTGATLSGGLSRSLLDLGLSIGSWVCLGDDGTNQSFVNPENNGLKRVKLVENSAITFDKSTIAMVTDAGTGKTIRLISGRIIKNEIGTDIVRTTLQFERILGAPDDASTDQQAEYVIGCVADTLDVVIKTADKVTMKLGFMARDQETRTAAEGLKDGERPAAVESDAFNSSSHVARLSLALVDEASEAPTDLFAFLLDCELSIKNNVKANKAIKYLGSFDNSAGNFDVDAKMTAYFATVEAIRSVRENSDVTLDMTFAQDNKGITFDLPLVTIATDGADVKQDEAIMLPITSAAAAGGKLDPNMNHTLLIQYWDYLPTLAA